MKSEKLCSAGPGLTTTSGPPRPVLCWQRTGPPAPCPHPQLPSPRPLSSLTCPLPGSMAAGLGTAGPPPEPPLYALQEVCVTASLPACVPMCVHVCLCIPAVCGVCICVHAHITYACACLLCDV